MIRILLVEDNAADVRLVYELLKEVRPWKYHVTRAGSLAVALQLLAGESFDVVLLDLGLPDSYGPQAVDPVLSAAPSVPVVILSGLQEESFALQAVQRGAQDYLTKGWENGEQLVRSIRYAILRRRWIGKSLPRASPRFPGGSTPK